MQLAQSFPETWDKTPAHHRTGYDFKELPLSFITFYSKDNFHTLAQSHIHTQAAHVAFVLRERHVEAGFVPHGADHPHPKQTLQHF